MSEESIQIAICNYIKYQYPKVLFNTDLSGIKLTIGQATKVKKMRSGRAWPDIFIAEPSISQYGLFIELKNDGQKLFKKDGITPINDHVKEQMEMLKLLRNKGYEAEFAIGFDDAKRIIDHYLNE